MENLTQQDLRSSAALCIFDLCELIARTESKSGGRDEKILEMKKIASPFEYPQSDRKSYAALLGCTTE